jgi:chemotaxis-related protein WspB
MLVLTFQIGPAHLALDACRVKEVVPRVRLEPVAGGPDWLAGVFVHRGRVVPVVDLHHLVGAGDCPAHLSSRIILVPYPPQSDACFLGLLASQVADLRDVPRPAHAPLHLTGAGQPDLGPVCADGDATLQLLDLDRLLPAPARAQLAALPGGAAP